MLRKFWIVLRIDAPGPREIHGGEYHQHINKEAAVKEARRLAKEFIGTRFAVLSAVHVVGFVDQEMIGDEEIPF